MKSFTSRMYKFFVYTALTFSIVAISISAKAANYFSIASGDWNTNIWSLSSGGALTGSTPGAGDNVTIERGFIVNVNLNVTCASLQLGGASANNAGTLDFSGAFSITVNGQTKLGGAGNTNRRGIITFLSGSSLISNTLVLGGTGGTPASGTITMVANSTMTVNGAITVNTVAGNVWTPSTGTLILTTTNTLPATIFTSFNNLTITANTTKLGLSVPINGTLDLTSGTLDVNTFTASAGALTGNGTLTNSGAADVFTAGSLNTNTSFTGTITGALAFIKTGTGTLTLSGNSSYTGKTTISNGTLSINSLLSISGGNTALGNPTTIANGTIDISSTGTLQYTGSGHTSGRVINITGDGATVDASGGGAIILTGGVTGTDFDLVLTGSTTGFILTGIIATGNATLTKNGAGTWTLAALNLYTGVTNINSGIIKFGAHGDATSGPLGTIAGGVIVANNAALDLAGYSETGNEPITLNGDGPYPRGALRNSGGADTYSGTITLASASSIGGVGGLITINGGTITGAFDLTLGGTQGGILTSSVATGTGKIIKVDAGTWTLPTSNTHTGGVTLNAGTLNINNNNALGNTTAGTFTITGGAIDNTTAGTITTPAHPLALNGDFAYTGSLARTLNLGAGAITMSADRQITVTAGALTAGGVLNQGALDLTKAGAGTLNFGANTITLKDLSINAGTLLSTSGTMNLAGDFSNSGTFTHNSGTVNFNGSVLQSISGSTTTTFNNLTANNSAGIATTGITLQTPAIIANTLTLTSGHITTTTPNLLTMNSGSLVSGANYAASPRLSGGSNNSFVNGPLRKIGSTAFLFPVGKVGAGLHYCGISAAVTATDSYTAEYMRASAYTQGNISAAGLAQISNCEYWSLTTTVGSPNRNVTLSWTGQSNCNPAVYVNDLATLCGAHNATTLWNTRSAAGVTDAGSTVTAGSLTWPSVTTYNKFTIGSTSAFTNPLPVKLVNVKAYRTNGMNKIEWTNMTETDVAAYDVQRSLNGIDFTSIATLNAKSNNGTREDYSRMDIPAVQTLYYRIKVRANDGMISYSVIVKVADGSSNQFNMVVYPNPVTGKQFTLQLDGPAAAYTLKVYGANGQMIKTENVQHPGGSFSKTIELPEHLSSGQYYLQLSGGEKILTTKFILQ